MTGNGNRDVGSYYSASIPSGSRALMINYILQGTSNNVGSSNYTVAEKYGAQTITSAQVASYVPANYVIVPGQNKSVTLTNTGVTPNSVDFYVTQKTPENVTVTFDSQGGSPVSPVTVPAGTFLGNKMPTDPARTNYTFDGWYTQPNGSGFKFTSTTIVNNKTTVYAYWNEIPPEEPTTDELKTLLGQISMQCFNTDVDHGNNNSVDFELIDGSYSIGDIRPIPNTGGPGGWGVTVTVNAAKYLEAFSAASGTEHTLISGASYQSVILHCASASDDWTVSSGTPIKFDVVCKTPSATTFTVTFDSNGGSDVAPITGIVPGSTIGRPADPSKENCDFSGWYKDDGTFAEAWDFGSDTVTESLTLHAKWTEKSVDPPKPEADRITLLYTSSDGQINETHYMDAPTAAGPVDLSDAIKSFGGYRFDSFSISSEPKETIDMVSLMSAEAISEETPAASLQQEVDALKAALVKDGVYASIDEIDADLDDYRDLAGQIDELNAKLKKLAHQEEDKDDASDESQ